jgi:hypothetical protein
VTELGFGDIWYFPKGQAHTIQCLDDENEYLLAFDDADFDRAGSVYTLNPSSLPFEMVADFLLLNLSTDTYNRNLQGFNRP